MTKKQAELIDRYVKNLLSAREAFDHAERNYLQAMIDATEPEAIVAEAPAPKDNVKAAKRELHLNDGPDS